MTDPYVCNKNGVTFTINKYPGFVSINIPSTYGSVMGNVLIFMIIPAPPRKTHPAGPLFVQLTHQKVDPKNFSELVIERGNYSVHIWGFPES